MNLELKNCLPAKASGKGLLKPSLVCGDASSHASRQPVLSVHLVAILSTIFPPLCALAFACQALAHGPALRPRENFQSFSLKKELAPLASKPDALTLENGL
jgi:hypothetical protein